MAYTKHHGVLMAVFEVGVEFSSVSERPVELYFNISSETLMLNSSTITSSGLSFLYHEGALRTSLLITNKWSSQLGACVAEWENVSSCWLCGSSWLG